MKAIFAIVLTLTSACLAIAEEPQLSSAVKASLVFRKVNDPASHYPHLLKVFLKLENIRDGEVSWVTNEVTGIDAELLDSNGKRAKQPPSGASISYNSKPFRLPYGSTLEWLISHGGISIGDDTTDKYVLIIGGNAWLIPMASVSSYTLRIRMLGTPWTSTLLKEQILPPKLLLELPPTRIEIIEGVP